MKLIQKIQKKKYRSSKTFMKRIEAANKRLGHFGKKNLTSNDVKLFQNMIKGFNLRYGIKTDKPEEISKTAWYTKEQQRELRSIINAIYNNPKTSYQYWRSKQNEMLTSGLDPSELGESNLNLDMVEKLHDKYGFTEEQEFIDFFDEMERFRNTSVVSKILDSDEERDLVEMGSSLDLDITDVYEIILDEYQRTGKTHTDLYNLVFTILINYERYGTLRGDEEE